MHLAPIRSAEYLDVPSIARACQKVIRQRTGRDQCRKLIIRAPTVHGAPNAPGRYATESASLIGAGDKLLGRPDTAKGSVRGPICSQGDLDGCGVAIGTSTFIAKPELRKDGLLM